MARIFGGRRRASAAAAVPASDVTPALAERSPFTGYEPGPGARSFTYAPWAPKDLIGQLPPGPSAGDIRTRREKRNYKG
jgi:hypothetical protein